MRVCPAPVLALSSTSLPRFTAHVEHDLLVHSLRSALPWHYYIVTLSFVVYQLVVFEDLRRHFVSH